MSSPTVRRAAAVVAFVAIFYAIMVPLRLVQHDALWFAHVSETFVSAAHSSSYISGLPPSSGVGDGKYYLAVAGDPTHARDYMPGKAGIVYARVGYPALAWLAGGGSRAALPAAMLAINVFAVLLATGAFAVWLLRRGLPAWPAALYGLYPGVIFSVFFDLTEPLAFACVALAYAVFDPLRTRRVIASGALLTLGLLTRETVVPFALAAAACLWVARRSSGRRATVPAAAFVLGTCVPLLIWRLIVGAYTHEPTQERSHTPNWFVPFRGFWGWRPLDGEHRMILLIVVAPAVVLGAAAVGLLVRRRASVAAALLLVNVLIYVVYLPKNVYIDYPSASRAVLGVLVAAFYCLPAWKGQGRMRFVLGAEAVACSLLCYMAVAWKYGLPSIRAITN